MFKRVSSVLALALVLGGAGQVRAEQDQFRTVIAPATCNHNGLQPNFGAGLGNWTGSTKSAYCGITRDFSMNVSEVKVMKVGGVTCNLKMIEHNGSTYWLSTHNNIINNGSYETIVFTAPNPVFQHSQALECDVQNFGLMNTIDVSAYFNDLI
jgi:hypothetical protein